MKQFNHCELDDSSKKQTGRTKKHKPSLKLFSKTCRSKVMISRNSFVSKNSKGASGTTSLSYLEELSGKLSANEEDLYCEDNSENFEEDQGVCLISSSSEIPCESLQKQNGSNEDSKFVCKDVTSETSGCREIPIFVDLTADEKNTWKQTILKRFDELETTENANDHENCSVNVVLEPRIMIADSSSKPNGNGGGSLATALRDRGPCLIPVQPNRSLPIHPAPCVPARSLRKDCSSLLVLPKSSTMDVVEVEPTKSTDKEAVRRNLDVEEEHSSSKELANSVDYVLPQISNVGSLNSIKRKTTGDTKLDKDSLKENRRRKRSQEADSTQREERAENSIKEFLKNFCGSNANEGAQNSCIEKCSRVVSSSKEEGNKVVPPLRLKKVIRTEIEGYTSRTSTESEHESNYRIVTGTTPRPSSSPVPSTWNNVLCEKDTNFSSSNTDSYKLEYRRNKLKQKLHELRGKALELAEQMASDCTSQQSTSMRQVMNRYEKQIENLSKLHSKLSAAIPVPSKVIDVNDDVADLSDDEDNEYLLMSFDDRQTTSPEPPKLSPPSPTNYDNILPEEIRNSPPILPRVVISSSQDLMDEKLQIAEKKVWPTNEKSMKKPHPVDPSQDVNKVSSDFEECVRTSTLSVDAEDFSEQSSSHPKKDLQNSPAVQESEKIKCLEFSESGSMMNLVSNGVRLTADVQDSEVLELKLGKRLPLSGNHVLQSTSFESAPANVPLSKINENARIVPKVALSLNQWSQFNTAEAKLNQENLTLQQNYKEEETTAGDNHLVTEQFPTLGNWLTRMSKKQVSKSKSKLQTAGNIPFTSTESSSRISEAEIHKIVGPNTANNSINATPQYNTERWQYHHQQQQRQQQLLQHVAASVTLSQPAPAIPPLRPSLYPSIPMTQFYPNNYAIDPYNSAALSYHSAICPYGSYPYHSRIHSGSLPGYHFPMQESLRPLQHLDKRFPPVQDTMGRYPSPSTSLQHPTNIDFDRIRGSGSVSNNVATCLPSLFVSPPSLSSSHQTLPRTSLASYPSNSQFTRNKMIPDVVAAAAAAAVVAAASIDRQHDTLSYNGNHSNPLTTAGIINGDAAHPAKTMISQDVINCTRNGNFVEKTRDNNSKYQQMQNFLYDRLTVVKTADNFAQTNSLIDNDQSAMTRTVSTPYQMPLASTDLQLSKSVVENELRNCDTPHLGKVSRSPNSLHNLVCSNCNSIAPKFKCLGCEMTFYCDERCQEKHWIVHVQRCPKKMPKLKKVT